MLISATSIKDKDGITVQAMLDFLSKCPKDAKVILNHKVSIANPEDDGTYSHGWVFDEIVEARCETLIDKSRYPQYSSKDGDLVWITHN